MVSLFRKVQDSPGAAEQARGAQGVRGRGNAMRDATLLGVIIALLPLAIVSIYLVLVREPGREAALVEHVSQSYALQQARMVSSHFSELRDRVLAAARSPLVMQAIAEQTTDDVHLVEQAILDYFPEAVSLRLLPLSEMGTADIDGGFQSLRNHIEIDLVRRVSNGEPAKPEAYQFEGAWLASIAQITTHPRLPARRAVVLVTVGAGTLDTLLDYPGEMPGQFTLEQSVFGGGEARNVVIASRGSGGDQGVQNTPVPDTPWRIEFRPSDVLIDEIASGIQPDYDVIGLMLIFTLLGFGVALQRSSAALSHDTERINAGAEYRTTLELRVPQLVPLARDLRKLTMRRARLGNNTNIVPVAEPQLAPSTNTAMTAVEGPSEKGLPPNIFRAYDIRGIADMELDDETVYRIGSAIGTVAGELGEQTLVLGYDGRASSSRLKAIVEKALMQSGRDVIDIGLVPTPILYFATQQLDAKSGVMITGSHNAAEYNGLKIVMQGNTVARGTIDKLRNIAVNGRFSKGTGHVIQQDVISEYLDEVVSDIAIAVPLKIVVDAGNGATGHIAPALLEELGCEIVPLYCEVDGRFPNHPPDTSNEDNLQDLVREVLAHDADFGVAYDGDGDRLAVVTGSGRIVRTDTLMMVFARDVVSRNPGADVVYDVKCSRNLAQLITGLGGRPVLWKTGHALMKEKMRETGAQLGGEFSGHIFFGERWFGFDDGMYATGRLAEILSSQDLTLDELIADLPHAVNTPEIIVATSDDEKFAIMERFVAAAQFADGKRNELDGLRVDFQDGWGLLRASNTGPALTARFEASDEATLQHIMGLFREQLEQVAPDLTIPF